MLSVLEAGEFAAGGGVFGGVAFACATGAGVGAAGWLGCEA
jgi:hypothetical protein